MLHEIRQSASGFFTKILMLFLVACFALWGIGDIVNKSAPKDIAQVGDQTISLDDFKFEMELMKRSFGEHYSEELVKSLNLYQVKLNELINRALVNQETAKLGINVGDETLAKSIAKESVFQNATGDFDKTVFKQVLRENNLSETEYLRKQRTNISTSVLLETFNIHPALPDNMLETLYDIKHEQRKVKLIVINAIPEKDTQIMNQHDINAFYEANKFRYTAPEYRTIQYIEILPEEIMKNLKISREESFEIYQQRIKDYLLPQKRHVSQLLYSTKAEAENAYGLLRSGTKLEEVAAKVSPKNKDAIDLGLRFKSQLTTGAEEVFSLEKGGFTAPIESAFGWHIFRVTEIEDEHTSDFESVQKSIEEELKQSKANDKLSEQVERLEDALSGGGTMEVAAKATGLAVHKLNAIDANGRGADTHEILSPLKYKELFTKAFSTAEKQRSGVITMADGRHFVVQVLSITPPRPRKLEEVIGLVQSDLKLSLKNAAMKDFAQVVATNAATLRDDALTTFLKAKGLGDAITTVVGRAGFPAGAPSPDKRLSDALPSETLDQLFTLKHVGEATKATQYGNGFIVARLVEKLPAPKADSEQGKQLMDALKRSMEEEHNNEVMDDFTKQLREHFPVGINTTVFEQITSSGQTADVVDALMQSSGAPSGGTPPKEPQK